VLSVRSQEVPVAALEDTANVVLQTIFFHRALGPLLPSVRFLSRWGVRLSVIGDEQLDQLVARVIDEFPRVAEAVSPSTKRYRMQVAFYNNVKRGSFLGISTGTDKKVWERWSISILAHSGPVLASPLGGLVVPTPPVPPTLPALAHPPSGPSASAMQDTSASSNPFSKRLDEDDDDDDVRNLKRTSTALPEHLHMVHSEPLAAQMGMQGAIMAVASRAASRLSHMPPIDFDTDKSLFYKFEVFFPVLEERKVAKASVPPPVPKDEASGAAAPASDGMSSIAAALGTRLASVARFIQSGPPSLLSGSS
jgi:hypothetical protein